MYSAGVFQDAPMVFPEGDCVWEFDGEAINIPHGGSQTKHQTRHDDPENGYTTVTTTATCNDARITTHTEETPMCKPGYTLDTTTNTCVADRQNCTPVTIDPFSVPALLDMTSTGVTATGSITGGTITHTATASCDNGTVNIEDQNSTVACNEGYENTSPHSCKEVPGFTTVWSIG